MKKAKRCLTAVVSGVLAASAVLSGCGQSKKEVSINDDHLTVYLWENRLMKNIASYIHEQFPDQDIEFIIAINEQISNFAQTYPTNLKASSNEALLFMRRYRFANCSCFSCCFKDAYPSSNVQ